MGTKVYPSGVVLDQLTNLPPIPADHYWKIRVRSIYYDSYPHAEASIIKRRRFRTGVYKGSATISLSMDKIRFGVAVIERLDYGETRTAQEALPIDLYPSYILKAAQAAVLDWEKHNAEEIKTEKFRSAVKLLSGKYPPKKLPVV